MKRFLWVVVAVTLTLIVVLMSTGCEMCPE
jgi:hypothetical protein